MVKHVLVTRPQHDRETSYLYFFTKPIIAKIKSDPKFQLTDIEGSKVTRQEFEDKVKKTNPGFLFLNGHGDIDSVQGHNDLSILDVENIGLTKGKIVYALACNSLLRLGTLAVNQGTLAYIGYRGNFCYIGDPNRSTTPEKDNLARPFASACNVLIENLLYGRTVKAAIEKTRIEYKKLMKNYGHSEDKYGDSPLVGLALSMNYINLGMVGDESAIFN